MTEFTIIIPVYNEEENLLLLEDSLKNYLPKALLPTSVLFINDGSTDLSEELLKEICDRNPHFHFVSLVKNKGLTTALKVGFDLVKSSFLGYMDADLQTHPDDFNLLLENINKYHLITGIRTHRKDSFLKNLSSRFANRFRRLFTNDGMKDTGCPLKVIHTEYAKRIPMFQGMHRFLPALILLQKGKIHQIPVRHFPRKHGKSKFGIGNRIFGPLIGCFAFLWMKRNYIHYKLRNSDNDNPRVNEMNKDKNSN